MLYYLVLFVYIVSCFLLLTVILLQQGKGGDMASAFGGSSSQTAFGARSGATLLTRATTVLAVIFMLGSLTLAILGQREPGSIMSTIPSGPAPAPASATPPATTPAAPAGTPSAPAGSPAPPAPGAPSAAPSSAPASPQPAGQTPSKP
jgi:preprotein translocase subunit SecG